MKANAIALKLLAVTWCVVFGVAHVLWLLGFYIGLPADGAAQAFSRPWFWYYNLFAGIACFIGIFIALGLTSEQRKPGWHRFVIIGGWLYTILLLLRSTGGLVQFTLMAFQGSVTFNSLLFWDFWFCLGFVAFAFCLRYYYRKKPRVLS